MEYVTECNLRIIPDVNNNIGNVCGNGSFRVT